MDTVYIDQSASELRLNLVEGTFDKDQLNILVSDTTTFNDIAIEAGVIGASHFVSVQFDEMMVSEIFACLEITNSGNECIVSKISEHKDSLKFFKNSAYKYEFSSNILEWNSESSDRYYSFEKRTKTASHSDKNIGLSYIFPTCKSAKFSAKTEVIVYMDDENIVIETLHAYPNEKKIVFTKTEIRREK